MNFILVCLYYYRRCTKSFTSAYSDHVHEQITIIIILFVFLEINTLIQVYNPIVDSIISDPTYCEGNGINMNVV